MNITIVGMGAMGSVYAALFIEDGHSVFGVDDWKEHRSAINSNGLRVEGASGSRTLRNIVLNNFHKVQMKALPHIRAFGFLPNHGWDEILIPDSKQPQLRDVFLKNVLIS